MSLSYFAIDASIFTTIDAYFMLWSLVLILLIFTLVSRNYYSWKVNSWDHHRNFLKPLSNLLKNGVVTNDNEFQETLTKWYKKADTYMKNRSVFNFLRFILITLFPICYLADFLLYRYTFVLDMLESSLYNQVIFIIIGSILILHSMFFVLGQEEEYIKRFRWSVENIIKSEVFKLDETMRNTIKSIKNDINYLSKVDFEKIILDLRQILYMDLFDILKSAQFKFDLYKIYVLFKSKGSFDIITIIDTYIENLNFILYHQTINKENSQKVLDALSSFKDLKLGFKNELKNSKKLSFSILSRKESKRVTRIYDRWFREIHNDTFWRKFITNVLEKTEHDYWDFKQTFEWWKSNERKVQKESKLKFCKHVCAFANSMGGVLLIGISDKIPRKIFGLDDIENKKKELYEIIRNHVRKFTKFFEIVDVKLSNEDGLMKDCILIVIKQTKDVKKVFSKEDGAHFYPKRESTGIEYYDDEEILYEKKAQDRDNYDFMVVLKGISNQ
ncbi:MAG: helix-turn-helix domain-containing protein [Promethearchaeota archaeon]